MSRRSALCVAVSAAALVIGAASIASAHRGGGGGHTTVSRTNVSRTNVSRSVSHTNVSHMTTTTRFHRTNVTNNSLKLTHANTGLRPPLTRPTFQPPPKAIQALQLHNQPTFQPPPKAIQALQLHNQPTFQPPPKAIQALQLHNQPTFQPPPKAIQALQLHNQPTFQPPPKAIQALQLHNQPTFQPPPKAVQAAQIHNAVVRLANNRFAPIWREQHRIWLGNRWRVFVPFTSLAAVTVGGLYYYPDSYVGFARPYCTGVTPEGCQLNWQQVGFQDGGSDWQCVQYCQRASAPPPPQAVTLAPQPPAEQQQPSAEQPPSQGSCEVTIFSDANFGGTPATTGDEQPQLSQSGWQNQIASIQVKSGNWDFFSDENYGGQAMRLQPGPYQDLGPEWSKKIGSFHCVQPGS